MVVCDSCRKVITKDDSRMAVSVEYIKGRWWVTTLTRDDVVLCPDCYKSVMSFIRNRVPREENR